MSLGLNVLEGVLNVHAVIAPGSGVDFGDGFEIAKIGRLDGRCVGRRPLPTKQALLITGQRSSQTHGSEKKRKCKAEQGRNGTGVVRI